MSRYLLYGTEMYALPILRPLAAAIARRGEQARWFLDGFDARPYLREDEVVLDSVRAVRAFNPVAVCAAANVVPPFFPGLKVQMFHGFSVGKRAEDKGHFRIRDLFDLYCTQGPSTTAPFEALARSHGHFRVRETGWPKLDPLFATTDPEADALRSAARGRRVILLGSTFTERLACAPVIADEVARLIATGEWYWLLTLHPKCPPEWFARYRAMQGEHARFVESDRLMSLLRAADVLLADTSSIVSEFITQGKPVVTFRNRMPAPHMIDVRELADIAPALRSALSPTPEHLAALDAYARAIHPYRDGASSERVLDAIARERAGDLPPLRRKPLNLWRTLRMRWRLRYFGV